MAVCSNYLDLMAYHMNNQLNTKNQENVYKFLSSVVLKMTACSIRLLMTNHQKPHIAKISIGKKKEREFRLIGVQAVLDSIIFQASFFQKSLKIKEKSLKNISKGKTQKWAFRDAFGRIEMTYASLFDGRHLINTNPFDFEEFRKKNWNVSIKNPVTFNDFFNLKGVNTRRDPDDFESSNHLFEFDYQKDFLTSKPKF